MPESHGACLNKGKNTIGHENALIESVLPVKKNSKSRIMPTCHHCDITGHIRPHCPLVCSQKPQIKKHDPKKGKSSTRPLMTHHAPSQKRQPS